MRLPSLLRRVAAGLLVGQLAVLAAFGCDGSIGCEELDKDGCEATNGCQYVVENAICAPPDGFGCFYVDEAECPAGTLPEVVAGGDGNNGCVQGFRCAPGDG